MAWPNTSSVAGLVQSCAKELLLILIVQKNLHVRSNVTQLTQHTLNKLPECQASETMHKEKEAAVLKWLGEFVQTATKLCGYCIMRTGRCRGRRNCKGLTLSRAYPTWGLSL